MDFALHNLKTYSALEFPRHALHILCIIDCFLTRSYIPIERRIINGGKAGYK